MALLGSAAIIVALIALHFYVTEVLPNIGEKAGISAYCTRVDGNAVVHVSVWGGRAENVVVRMGEEECHLGDLSEGSSDVCVFTGASPTERYVVTALVGGKEVRRGDVCTVSVPVAPD